MVINNDYNEERAGIQQMLANSYGYKPSDVYQDVYMQNAREQAYNDIQEQNARADAQKQAELLATNIGMAAVARSSATYSDFDPSQEFTATIARDNSVRLINNSNLYGSGIKYMAMQDPGGILGTSLRTYAARFAGSREILANMPPELQEEITEFQDALAYATGSDGGQDSWGAGNTGTTIGKLVSGSWDYWTGGDGYMRGMEPGTAFFDEVMSVDPDWDDSKKQIFIDNFLTDENRSTWAMMGINEDMIKGSKSIGGLMAQIIERKTAYESGEHAATASGWTKTGMFIDNIGRTILADPDTAAEFGIALGAAAFTGGASLGAFAAKAGGTAAASALRAASRSAGLRALTTLTRSRTAAATAANRTRQVGLGARKLGHWTANGLNRVAAGGKIVGNLNPFAAAENIVLPAIRDVRTLSNFATRGAGRIARGDAALMRQLKDLGAAGVAGSILKDVFVSTAPISFKAGIAANMVDGALGNALAYQMSRDDEYMWAKYLYGDDRIWDQYRSSLFGSGASGHGPSDFMNSLVGSAVIGGSFGMVLGGVIRGIGVARFKAEQIGNPENGTMPRLVTNPVQAIRSRIRAQSDYMNGKTGNSAMQRIIAADRNKTVDLGTEQLLRGFMVSEDGAVKGKTLKTRARQLAQLAYDGGIDIQTLLRHVTRKDGSIDMREVATYVRKNSMTKANRARKRARTMHANSQEARATERALHTFNATRIQRLIDEGVDWDDVDHVKIFDEIIGSLHPNSPLRPILHNYKKALTAEADNTKSALHMLVASLARDADMDPAMKQKIVDDFLVEMGLRSVDGNKGVSINVKDVEAKLAKKDRAEVKKRTEEKAKAEHEARVKELEAKARDARLEAERLEALEAKGTTRTADETQGDLSELYIKAADEATAAEADVATARASDPTEIDDITVEDIAVRETLEEEIGTAIVNERLKSSAEASTMKMEDALAEVEMAALRAADDEAPQTIATNIAYREIVRLSENKEYDARTGRARFTLKHMADATKRNAEALLKVLPGARADQFSTRANAALEIAELDIKQDLKRKKKRQQVTKAAMINKIRKDFGVELNADASDAAIKKGTNLELKDLKELYKDLHILKEMGEMSDAARLYVAKKMQKEAGDGFDPMILIAAGDPKAQRALLQKHLSALYRLRAHTDAEGNVPIDVLIREWPEDSVNMIHSVYAKTAENEAGHFHIDEMIIEAENRIARTDENLNRSFREGMRKRMEGMEPTEASLFQRMHQFDNRVAQTQEFLANRADSIADPSVVDHRSIIENRARNGNQSVSQYLHDQELDFAKAIFDGWRQLPVRVKQRIDQRMRQLGLEGWSRRAEIWTDDAFDQELHGMFGREIWDAMQEHVGVPVGDRTKTIDQMNGNRNSARGYEVGRAVIEALANHGDVDANIRGDVTDMPSTGYMGRLRNDNFIKLYKQHYGEAVRDWAQNDMGSHVDSQGRRMMTMAELDAVINSYDALAQRLREVGFEGLTPAEKQRISQVKYDNMEDVGLAPEDLIKDLTGRLKTVRQQYEERVAMVEMLPPAVMSTLHDEYKFLNDAHASVFGVGVIPGEDAVQGLRPDVSGDAGFGGAAFVPGSALHFITLRSGQMFGTVKGLADAASHYGMDQLSKHLKTKGLVETLKELETAKRVANSRDASAQATTIGQLIYRDFEARHGTDAAKALSQKQFNRIVDEVHDMLYDMGGGAEMEARLKDLMDEYIPFAQKEELYDNYSAAGVEAVSRADDAWQRLVDAGMLARVAEGEDTATTAPKVGGNALADWARKELFKPPVMTVVYAVGEKGVRGQMNSAIDKLLADPEAYGVTPDLVAHIQANRTDMVNSLAYEMIGKGEYVGAVREVLDIPKTEELIKMVQSRDAVFRHRDVNVPMQEILTGDWKNREDANVVAHALKDEAKNVLGIDDLGLGLWLIKLRDSSPDDTRNAIAMMQRAVQEAQKGANGDKNTILRNLRSTWKPVSGMLKSVESANRVAHTYDGAVMRQYMEEAGISENDLSPMARRALAGDALYDRTREGAGREQNAKKSTMGVRAQDQESLEEGKGAHISQAVLEDSHRNIFGGGDEEEFGLRVRNAVARDLIFELGPYILPPSLRDDQQFIAPTMRDFISAVYDYNLDDVRNTHGRRKRAALSLQNKIDNIKKKGGDATDEELQRLAKLQVLAKTLFHKGEATTDRPDAVFHENYGSHMMAGMMRAEALISTSSTKNSPTQMGVADVQTINHAMNSKEMQMMRRDQEWLDDPSANAFSFSETATASPLDPAYIDAAKASRGRVDGEPVPSMDEIGNTLSKRTAHRSEASIAAENGKDKKLAGDRGTTVGGVRMDRLDQRLKALAEREADKAMDNLDIDKVEKAKVVQRQTMKNKILQGFRNTFGYGAGEAEQKRNMYKLGQGGVIRGSDPMKSPFEAVGQFVLDNDMVNHMGWLAGPQYAAGLFLTRWDATKKEFASTEGPASVAMAPLSVFARDYKLVGTAARDYPMVTAFRIAEETDVPVEDVIADMNANGFFAVHKKWIDENYNNLADEDSQIRFEENGLAAAGMVSDIRRKKLSEKGQAQLDEASDAWLRELGGAEGTLDNLEWVDGRIDFIGVREHLKSHPSFFRRLQKVAGQEFTIDEFAAQLSLSRQDLVDMAVRQQQGKQQPGDMPVVITPRTEGDVVAQNQIDYVNGMEVVDHNIVPGREGEVPLFTESQMIHVLNLSSNRKLVKNIIDAHRFGMDIDPSKELDNILRTSNDDFAMGNAVHGFETSVRSEQDAKRLQAASENEEPLFDMGKRVAKDYGLKNIPAGELEVLGLVHTLYNTGLILKGNKISKEGMEVLAAFFPEMDGSMRIETAERLADMITDKKTDIWNGAAARRTALSAAESEAEYRADPMPPRDEAADEARDESGNPLPVEDPYDLGDVDPETAPVLDIHEKTSEPSHSPPLITDITIDSPQNDRLGNMFLSMLEHRHRIDGSQAAGNAAAVFKNLTGRDGTANGISSAEAMLVMEMSFVDKDFQNALWGGEMDVADGGPLSMTFVEERSGRLQSKLSGLAEVKKAMKDKGISAAAYMLTHELVERLDFANMVRGRAKGSAKMNQVSSSVGRLFMENFGTAEGRTKWKKIFKEIGVYDGKIKEFMETAERLTKDDMTVAETQGASARLRAEGGDEARDVMTEGFTQVLTMALMAKQGRKESTLGKRFGGPLVELAEALAGKMHKVADHVGRYGVTDRNTDSAAVLSGAFLKDDQRLDSLVYNTLGNMAKNVKYDKLVRREETRVSYRMWGGKPDIDDVSPVSRSIGDVQAEMRILNEKLLAASGRGRQVIQLQLNSLEQELFGLTNDPRHVMPDDAFDEVFENFADESGLVDTRGLGDGEGFKVEMKAIDEVLGNVETKQSRGLGAGMNYVAGKFNAGGALSANNSEFDVIRAMWALANPEAVNTQLNNNKMWLSDQMAADALSRDKRNMMGAMRMVEKRLNKLSSSKDPDKNLANQREVVKFFENKDRAQAQQDLADLGFKANEVNALEAARQELFEPQTGFIARLAKAMYETGAMGKKDYETVAANPRLPRSLRKDMVNNANAPEIRGYLAGSIQTHLSNTKKNGYKVDVAEMAGVFMDDMADASQRKAEYDAMPEDLQTFYREVASQMPDKYRPANFDSLSAADRAFAGSEFYKKWMVMPRDVRPELGVSDVTFKRHYEDAINTDTPMAHSTRGGLTRQERMFQQKAQYRNRIGDDTYQPESLLDGMAHLDMLELKKGTRLAPLRFAGDFDRTLDRYPDMGKFVDYNPQQAGIRLLSSNAPRAWAAAHQQHAFGIKGMSTLGMIENFKRRLQDGIPMDDLGIPAEKRAAFAQQLTVLENQVRNAAYDMRPVDVDLSSDGDRNLTSMARGSVAVMSGGNFALSALAEVFATIPRTLGNMIQGDFAAIGDYFAGLSPRARQEALANVNGWETAKMEMGMRSRMGDMGIDSLEEMLDRDSAPTLTDRLEDGTRKMQKFSMAGMRTFTEYSRTVATRQSMRKNIRMAGRGAFGKFAVEVKGLSPEPTLKEIRGAARKAGMDPMLAVSMHQNGVLDAGMLRQLQEVFGDNNYFDVNGLKVDNFNRAFGGDERLRAVVTHVLQFENNKVNLDTRIGNKQMPKNVVEQLIGALGQYPMLFYSRMRQGAWQGGALLGTAAIILPLALGEIYYHVLTETAREGNTEPIEKWGRDPLGAMASVISKMNISGGFTPLQSWGTATLVQSIRQATENPAFMEGFNTQTFGMSPINAAGLGMFVSGIRKFSSASTDIMNGDYQSGIRKAKDLGPFSYKQIWKGLFNMMLQDEKLGKAMMRGSQGSPQRAPRGLSRPQGVAATPQPVQAPQAPQTAPERPSAPQPRPTPKPSLGDSLDGQQVSAEDLGSALDGDKT